MSRTALALAIAPLWVPLIVMGFEYRAHVPPPGARETLAVGALVAFNAYLAVYLFGLPGFLALRSRRRTGWIAATALGGVVGILALIPFDLSAAIAVHLMFDIAVPWAVLGLAAEIARKFYFLYTAPLGMLVGLTLWLIARPDRLDGELPAMRRTVLAAALAPLWVPLSIAASADQLAVDLTLGTAFAYLGMLALGIPGLLLLRARRLTGLPATALLGLAVGVATWLLFRLCFDPALDDGLRAGLHDALELCYQAALGALVGATLWLIARPDR